ncbi:MAG: hypothetical protein AAF734_09085, partial [Bacteroidota bacterium]
MLLFVGLSTCQRQSSLVFEEEVLSTLEKDLHRAEAALFLSTKGFEEQKQELAGSSQKIWGMVQEADQKARQLYKTHSDLLASLVQREEASTINQRYKHFLQQVAVCADSSEMMVDYLATLPASLMKKQASDAEILEAKVRLHQILLTTYEELGLSPLGIPIHCYFGRMADAYLISPIVYPEEPLEILFRIPDEPSIPFRFCSFDTLSAYQT